jgi:general secretion pathway protein C
MNKYFFIILGSIGAALLIALLVISYVDRTVLHPVPSSGEATAPEIAGGPPGTSDPAVAAGKPLPAPITPEDGGAPVPAALNLRLIGTTVFGDKSTAIIEDLDTKTRGVYRLRDAIKGYILSIIDADSVTLTSGSRSLTLTRSPGGDQPDADSFFTKIDDSTWLVSADKASDMVSNLDQYAGQIIAFQHREHGEAAGFKIRHLKDGNDFEKLGLKNNDIIKRVNGLEVNDLTDVLKAVYQLSDETEFTVEVERGEGTQDLNYRLDKDVNALVPIITRMLSIPLAGTGRQ